MLHRCIRALQACCQRVAATALSHIGDVQDAKGSGLPSCPHHGQALSEPRTPFASPGKRLKTPQKGRRSSPEVCVSLSSPESPEQRPAPCQATLSEAQHESAHNSAHAASAATPGTLSQPQRGSTSAARALYTGASQIALAGGRPQVPLSSRNQQQQQHADQRRISGSAAAAGKGPGRGHAQVLSSCPIHSGSYCFTILLHVPIPCKTCLASDSSCLAVYEFVRLIARPCKRALMALELEIFPRAGRIWLKAH